MKAKSRTTLFLMEMIIAVFFFAVTSAICTQVFAKAHLVSTRTGELNQAILRAESIAEAFRSVDGDFNNLCRLFPEADAIPSDQLVSGARSSTESGYLEFFYDADWNPCDKETADYKLMVNLTDEDDIRTAQISVIQQVSDETIYSMDVHKHPRLEADYE